MKPNTKHTLPALLAALAALALLLLTGCGGGAGSAQKEEEQPTQESTGQEASPYAGDFAGKVQGTDAFLGLTVGRTGEVLTYACDGADEDEAPEISEWFRGEVAEDGSLELSSQGGATLSAAVSEDGTEGTLALPDGTERAFASGPVEGEAGLYRAEGETEGGEEYVGGWISLGEGDEQRGALGIRDGTSNTLRGSRLDTKTLEATGTVKNLQAQPADQFMGKDIGF